VRQCHEQFAVALGDEPHAVVAQTPFVSSFIVSLLVDESEMTTTTPNRHRRSARDKRRRARNAE
jgi:hypothetical protein